MRALELSWNPQSERSILRFWAPLAATWLMMAVEEPFRAAVIARLPEAKINFAACGVAFAIAMLVESPGGDADDCVHGPRGRRGQLPQAEALRPTGRACIRGSSDGWRQAAVAAGEQPGHRARRGAP